jgi:hypothetical protein
LFLEYFVFLGLLYIQYIQQLHTNPETSITPG